MGNREGGGEREGKGREGGRGESESLSHPPTHTEREREGEGEREGGREGGSTVKEQDWDIDMYEPTIVGTLACHRMSVTQSCLCSFLCNH